MRKFFKVLDRIFEIATPVIFIAYGIVVLVFSGFEFVESNKWILNLLLIISGVASIVDFIGGHKIKHDFNFDIAFGIISISIGVIQWARNADINSICLVWGIFEIVKGAFEIQHLIVELKEKEFIAIAHVVCAILEVIFGILLVIEMHEDIRVHLIVAGIVCLISATASILETIIEHRHKALEEK